MTTCSGCGEDFPTRLWHGRPTKYCDRSCYVRNVLPFNPKKSPPLKVWPLPFTKRPNVKGTCSTRKRGPTWTADRRREYMREYMREYERRTHRTAIKYWQVAKTPEALKLAKTYFELRQTIRGLDLDETGTV